MSTLIDTIKGMMTPQLFGSLAAKTGAPEAKVRSGMTAGSVSIMEGLAGKAHDSSAMGEVIRLIEGTPDTGDPARLLDQDAPIHQSASRLLSLVTSDAPGLIKRLAGSLGLGGSVMTSLLSAAAGIVFGGLSKFSRARGGLNASSLASTLIDETPAIRAMAAPPVVEHVADTRYRHPAETVRVERPAKRSPLMWLLAAIPLALIGIWLAKRPHRKAETPTTGATVGEVVRQSRDAVPRLEPPAIETPSVTTPEVAQTQHERAPAPQGNPPSEETGAFDKYGVTHEPATPEESGAAVAPEPSAQTAPEPMDNAAALLEKQAAGSEKKEWVDLTLNFETGKADVPATGTDEIASIAKVLQNKPDLKIEVAGFTDATGSAKRNMALSALRAQHVKQALVDKGIDASRIKTKAFGATNLAEQTKEAAEANRRVAVRITGG